MSAARIGGSKHARDDRSVVADQRVLRQLQIAAAVARSVRVAVDEGSTDAIDVGDAVAGLVCLIEMAIRMLDQGPRRGS